MILRPPNLKSQLNRLRRRSRRNLRRKYTKRRSPSRLLSTESRAPHPMQTPKMAKVTRRRLRKKPRMQKRATRRSEGTRRPGLPREESKRNQKRRRNLSHRYPRKKDKSRRINRGRRSKRTIWNRCLSSTPPSAQRRSLIQSTKSSCLASGASTRATLAFT